MSSLGNRQLRTLAMTVSLALVAAPAFGQSKAVPAHGIDPAIGRDEALETLALVHGGLEEFVEAVNAAGLAESLMDGTEYTIFAPTDKALEEVHLEELMKPGNRAALVAMLRAHIVAHDVDWETARTIGAATTIDGRILSIAIEGDELRVGDATTAEPSVVVGSLRIYPVDTVLSASAPPPLARLDAEHLESR